MFSFSEVLVASSKETDLDVNAEETKDMIGLEIRIPDKITTFR